MKRTIIPALSLALALMIAPYVFADGSTADPSALPSERINGAVAPDSGATRGAESPSMRGDDSTRGAGMQTRQLQQTSRASQLMDKNVQNMQGEKLGKITDIVIDPSQGRAAYVVMQAEEGDRLYAIPTQALTTSGTAPDVLIVNLTKDRLKSAPSFTKDQWAKAADRQWIAEVYRFYGIQPAW
ncbi:MAG: PRC-barrel domain-containing protein [Nitrospirota bacterium]